jgi:hypothetical protein
LKLEIRRIGALGALAVLTALGAGAARAEIDFSDFDTFLMQTMEDTLKALEPHIGGKNVAAATEDAQVLREGLQWAESYFAAKGGADDAVALAKEGQEHAAAVATALESGDFEAAAAAARGVAKTCRACHDAYRP